LPLPQRNIAPCQAVFLDGERFSNEMRIADSFSGLYLASQLSVIEAKSSNLPYIAKYGCIEATRVDLNRHTLSNLNPS
jgi:hypothetical protein